jgi:hypothetical protein
MTGWAQVANPRMHTQLALPYLQRTTAHLVPTAQPPPEQVRLHHAQTGLGEWVYILDEARTRNRSSKQAPPMATGWAIAYPWSHQRPPGSRPILGAARACPWPWRLWRRRRRRWWPRWRSAAGVATGICFRGFREKSIEARWGRAYIAVGDVGWALGGSRRLRMCSCARECGLRVPYLLATRHRPHSLINGGKWRCVPEGAVA